MNAAGNRGLTRLDEIIEEFAELEPRERLELLLEFAERLPPLPKRYRAEREAGEHRIPECQTPVYLWVEVADGTVALHADVAPEAPTVQGFVSILVEGLTGADPTDVLTVPRNLLQRLGLLETLGMVRMRGLNSIVQRIINEVRVNSAGNG